MNSVYIKYYIPLSFININIFTELYILFNKNSEFLTNICLILKKRDVMPGFIYETGITEILATKLGLTCTSSDNKQFESVPVGPGQTEKKTTSAV